MEGAELSWTNVPSAWAEDAEEVRAHLCLLRGRSIFLSPADGWLLLNWMENGVGVPSIVLALERAADARRRRRAKAPLKLQHAKRHLGKSLAVRRHGGGEAGTIEPQTSEIERQISGIEERGEMGFRRAMTAARAFFESAWAELGPSGQEEQRMHARAALGDLLGMVDQADADALVEERARDALRVRFPSLSAGALSARFEVELG